MNVLVLPFIMKFLYSIHAMPMYADSEFYYAHLYSNVAHSKLEIWAENELLYNENLFQ